MSYQYDYNAEATGHVIGLRHGYEQGHEAGYVDGHNDTAARWQRQIDEKWAPLVDRLTAERDEAIRARDVDAAEDRADLDRQDGGGELDVAQVELDAGQYRRHLQ